MKERIYTLKEMDPVEVYGVNDRFIKSICSHFPNLKVVPRGEKLIMKGEEEQIEAFRKQIRLANRLRMPIMIHTRDANQLTMDILTEEGAFSEERIDWFPPRLIDGKESPDARVQLHCYSGSPELALEYVKKGATISLGGPVTFKNGRKAMEVARAVPIEALLSETDAPYMAPEPLRGRQNRSEYVEHVVRRIALLHNMSFEETGRILTENGKRFFEIDE